MIAQQESIRSHRLAPIMCMFSSAIKRLTVFPIRDLSRSHVYVWEINCTIYKAEFTMYMTKYHRGMYHHLCFAARSDRVSFCESASSIQLRSKLCLSIKS